MKGWMQVSAHKPPDLGGNAERREREWTRINKFREKYPGVTVVYTNFQSQEVLYEGVDVWIECEIEKWPDVR